MKNLTPQNRLCDLQTNRLKQLLANTLESAGRDSDGAKALQRELKRRDSVSIETATALLEYEKEASAEGLLKGLGFKGPRYERTALIIAMMVRHCAVKGWSHELLLNAAELLRDKNEEEIRKTVVLIADGGSVDLETLSATLDQFLAGIGGQSDV